MSNGTKVKMFKNAWVAFIVLLPLTFIAAFRWDVGVDSVYGGSYWESYHAAAEGENIRDFEPLFCFFLVIVSKFELPFFWLLFVHSIIFMICVSYGFSKGSISPVWTIIVFFLIYGLFDCFTALRQGMAEGLVIIALGFMIYLPAGWKKDLTILLFLITATFFHTIAIIMIPVYIISKIKFTRIGLLKFSGFCILAYPVIQVILSFLGRIIANEKGYVSNGVASINLLLSMGIFLLCWYYYDNIKALDENAYIYINISLVIFIFMLNSGALTLAFRYFDMLKTSYFFIIPYLVKGIKNGIIRLGIQLIVLSVFCLWFVNAFFLQTSSAAEYQTVFEDWETYTNLP